MTDCVFRRDHSTQQHHCDQCERVYPLLTQLKQHKMSAHTANELKRFQCKRCNKGFSQQKDYQRHMETHDGAPKAVKKRVCDICGTETNERTYRHHLNRMHGKVSLKCEECDMTFKHSSALLEHKKTVHTFTTCELCGDQVRVRQMKLHKLQKHTDMKDMPYICNVCSPPRGFAKRIIYEDHTNIHVSQA